jgi:hypothetical protein
MTQKQNNRNILKALRKPWEKEKKPTTDFNQA